MVCLASVAAGLVRTAVSHVPRREGIGDGRLRGRPLPAAACAVGAALLSHPLVPAVSVLPQ